jgi:hypothetical protein
MIKRIEYDEYWSRDRAGRIGTLNPEITPNLLTALFGQPDKGDGFKVTQAWYLKKVEGGREMMFSIYDYRGDRWHVGGDPGAVEFLERYIAEYRFNRSQA